MGIFRKRSRFTSQSEFDQERLIDRLRDDFSQPNGLVEMLGDWIGNSRARIALIGFITVLALLGFWLLVTLFFGTPNSQEQNFERVASSMAVSEGLPVMVEVL